MIDDDEYGDGMEINTWVYDINYDYILYCITHKLYIYILAFANKVPVFLTCPCSHARAACYRELYVWVSAIALAEAAPPCFIHVFSRFALVLPHRACAGRLHRGTAAPPPLRITSADCPNECLYQFGSQSVQPFGRQRWICSLSVYARVCTHTHARAHIHTHIHTHTHTHTQ
jgi:hypothetical protein